MGINNLASENGLVLDGYLLCCSEDDADCLGLLTGIESGVRWSHSEQFGIVHTITGYFEKEATHIEGRGESRCVEVTLDPFFITSIYK